jgi:hypothetical protein
MKPHTRRAIAYIAARLISKADTTNIYDNSEARNYSFSGNVGKGNVAIYDHEQQCEIRGTPKNLFHHGNSKYINLRTWGKGFKGFDSESDTSFHGNVESRNVTLYDPKAGRRFSYWV